MKWTSYAEQPPPKGEPVLVVSTCGCFPAVEVGTRYNDGFDLETGSCPGWVSDTSQITHWMPLPEPPETE